jgi:exopolysaccharide biosynthesis polyprenyl glycosylphosphotransferase
MTVRSDSSPSPISAAPIGTIRYSRLIPWLIRGVYLTAGLVLIGAALREYGSGTAITLAAVAAPLLFAVEVARGDRLRRPRRDHDLLIVGRNRRTRDYITRVSGNGRNVKVVGILDSERNTEQRCDDELHSCHRALDDLQIPYLGGHHRLHEVVRRRPIDEVVITLPIKSCYDEITHCLSVCHEAGIPASVSTDLFEIDRPRPGLVGTAADGVRLHYKRTHRPRWKMGIKRAIDIVGSASALLILAIPMLVIAIAVKLTSRGPILYWQQRCGVNGKTFRFPKFRTMVVNADQLRKQIEHLNEQEGPVFKMKNDPRITRVGRILRRYSLDEFPQFFCVLVGQMSMVGPRPPIPAEVEQYEWWQRRRLSVKPGLTCIWQVQGRNDIPFREWMLLDLRYIDEWSLGLDLKLIAQTIPAMIRGSGV